MEDDGRMANSTFLDYRVPLALDLPMIDTVIVEKPSPAPPVWREGRRRGEHRAAAGCAGQRGVQGGGSPHERPADEPAERNEDDLGPGVGLTAWRRSSSHRCSRSSRTARSGWRCTAPPCARSSTISTRCTRHQGAARGGLQDQAEHFGRHRRRGFGSRITGQGRRE